MPELPEVEIVVRQLREVLLGKEIQDIEVLREKSFSGSVERMLGKTITDVERVAKMIVMTFDNTQARMLGHLKMTGQLVWRSPKPKVKSQNSKVKTDESAKADDFEDISQVAGGHPSADWVDELPSSHTRVIVRFADESVLYFNDQRVFGWLKVVSKKEYEALLGGLPPDVVDGRFDVELLLQAVKSSRRAIKLIILDQKKMGGMGNIYANDALWKAKIKPSRRGTQVRKYEVERLHAAMVAVIERAIELGGSTYSHFVDTQGIGGSYQDEFLVYDREGERCLRDDCDGIIVKESLGGRGTYWCPMCQT